MGTDEKVEDSFSTPKGKSKIGINANSTFCDETLYDDSIIDTSAMVTIDECDISNISHHNRSTLSQDLSQEELDLLAVLPDDDQEEFLSSIKLNLTNSSDDSSGNITVICDNSACDKTLTDVQTKTDQTKEISNLKSSKDNSPDVIQSDSTSQTHSNLNSKHSSNTVEDDFNTKEDIDYEKELLDDGDVESVISEMRETDEEELLLSDGWGYDSGEDENLDYTLLDEEFDFDSGDSKDIEAKTANEISKKDASDDLNVTVIENKDLSISDDLNVTVIENKELPVISKEPCKAGESDDKIDDDNVTDAVSNVTIEHQINFLNNVVEKLSSEDLEDDQRKILTRTELKLKNMQKTLRRVDQHLKSKTTMEFLSLVSCETVKQKISKIYLYSFKIDTKIQSVVTANKIRIAGTEFVNQSNQSNLEVQSDTSLLKSPKPVKKKHEDYISEDKEENEDNFSSKWNDVKELKTLDDCQRYTQKAWKSFGGTHFNHELVNFGFRKYKLKSTGKVKLEKTGSKRKRTLTVPKHEPITKRRRVDPSSIFNEDIELCRRNLHNSEYFHIKHDKCRRFLTGLERFLDFRHDRISYAIDHLQLRQIFSSVEINYDFPYGWDAEFYINEYTQFPIFREVMSRCNDLRRVLYDLDIRFQGENALTKNIETLNTAKEETAEVSKNQLLTDNEVELLKLKNQIFNRLKKFYS